MATISVTTSRGLVSVDLNVWEKAGSGNPSTNKSTVEYSVVIRRGSKTWDTSWAGWGTRIYASIYIDYMGSKTIYVPTYNYNGTCPPGSVISSGSFEVEHDSSGNRSVGFNLSFTDNADGNNNGSYYTPGDAGTVYGSVALANIPRYAAFTSHYVSSADEHSVAINWGADVACDAVQYSLNGGGWTNPSGGHPTYYIGGLTANTGYRVKTRIKRTDSQLWTESGEITFSTYNYPHVTGTPNFTIGNTLRIDIYNPLGRGCNIYLVNPLGEQIGGDYITNTFCEGYTGQNFLDCMYKGIPNTQSGRYQVRLVCSALNRDTTVDGGIYSIKGTEVPTFTSNNITNVVDTLHNEDITGLATKIIKGHNKITGNITKMTPNNYSNGSRYVISANANPTSQEISYDNGATKSFKFDNITTNSFSITAFDSRGLSTAASKTIDLIEYNIPKINNFTITRQNGLGTYAILTADGVFTHWNGWNEIKKYNSIQRVVFRYKASVDSAYSDWLDITEALTKNAEGSWTLTKTLDISFDTTTKYDFQIYVQDVLESSNIAVNSLSTANGFLWRDLKNKRLGINKKPDHTLDIGGDANMTALYIDGRKMIWYE